MTPARKATLFLLSTTVLWGSSFLAMKEGTAAMEKADPAASRSAIPVLYSLLRFAAAAILFLPLAPRSLKRVFARPELAGSFWVALFGFLGMTVQGWSLQGGSSTITAFLVNLTVITTPVFGLLFFREKLSAGGLAGVVLALIGAFVLTRPTEGGLGRPEIFAGLGALFFGLQIQLIGRVTKGRDPEAMTLGMFLHFTWLNLLALLLMPGGAGLLAPERLQRMLLPDLTAIKTLLYLAVFGSAVAMWIFMRWQREIPAWRAAIIYCLEPAFAAFFGWWLAGERLGAHVFAGGLLIILANLAPELLKRKAPAPDAAPGSPA